MFFSGRAPISSPSSNDNITKLQTTLNNILHCLTDALHLLPDLAPKVASNLQIEENKELEAVKHDIVYRANYIATGFECANELIYQMSQMIPLKDSNGAEFLERIKELKTRNNEYSNQLRETSDKCRTVLNDLNNAINCYVSNSIDENINSNNSENVMELILGEMYEITK